MPEPCRNEPQRLYDHAVLLDSRATILAIGCVSENAVRTALELGRDFGIPVVLLASRGQVETKAIGEGYLAGGTNQSRLMDLVQKWKVESTFHNAVLICRDHAGPAAGEIGSVSPLRNAMTSLAD